MPQPHKLKINSETKTNPHLYRWLCELIHQYLLVANLCGMVTTIIHIKNIILQMDKSGCMIYNSQLLRDLSHYGQPWVTKCRTPTNVILKILFKKHGI